jgi:hypothetical protein
VGGTERGASNASSHAMSLAEAVAARSSYRTITIVNARI